MLVGSEICRLFLFMINIKESKVALESEIISNQPVQIKMISNPKFYTYFWDYNPQNYTDF